MTNDNHSQSKPLLSIIMPVYNERDTISAIIKLVRAVPLSKEIIVIDDGSTDGTQEVLKSMTGDDLVLLLQEKNAGKGAAIRVGIPHVSGEIAIIQDADTEYDPQDYHALIKPIQEGKAEVVYGSRFLMPEAIEQGSRKLRWPDGMRFPNWFINRFLAWLSNVFYKADITDEATCYKVFKAEVLKSLPLTCERFEFCPEVTAKLRRRNYKIVEVPISYHARTTQQGKKINWRDGFEAIWTLLRYRFWK